MQVLSEQNWKLSGIANGIDYNDWHPERDPLLATDGYKNYKTKDVIEGKRHNKAALQRELGLPVNPDVPLLGFIGRMDYQKGVDFIHDSYHWIMGEGAQLVMLGSGRDDLENALREMEEQRKDQCRYAASLCLCLALLCIPRDSVEEQRKDQCRCAASVLLCLVLLCIPCDIVEEQRKGQCRCAASALRCLETALSSYPLVVSARASAGAPPRFVVMSAYPATPGGAHGLCPADSQQRELI